MASSYHLRTTGTQTHPISSFFQLLSVTVYSGMESLIKSQKDMITELEAKIEANMEELKKVSSLHYYMHD